MSGGKIFLKKLDIVYFSILCGALVGFGEIQGFPKTATKSIESSSSLAYRKLSESSVYLFLHDLVNQNRQVNAKLRTVSVPPPKTKDTTKINSSKLHTEARIHESTKLNITNEKLTLSSVNTSVETMIVLFRDFIIDYVIKKDWRNAYFVVPKTVGLSQCQHFTVPLFLSKAAISVNCSDESILNSIIKTESNHNIIFADFLHPAGDFLHKKILIDYSSQRKIIFLTANNRKSEQIAESIQPKILSNYKWTLVHLRLINVTNTFIDIYKVYGFATSAIPISQWVGTWDMKKGLHIDPSRNAGLASFHGRTLRITAINTPPISYLTRPIMTSFGGMSIKASGYLPDLLDIMSIILDFRCFVVTPIDGKFGNKEDSGNWTGMVGMLQHKQADVAISSFSYTFTRKLAMDFSPPVEYSSTRLLIRRDWKSAELKLNAYLQPFEWKVWLTIVVLIGTGTMTLIVFASFELFRATPAESFWILSTCFLLQGQDEHSVIQATPFRIASGTFWLLSVFIFACYTARLTSFLAGDSDKLPVNDLSEAVKSGTWKIGFTRGSPYIEKVKESKAADMAMLWKRLQGDPSVLVSGFQEGIAKVFQERYIYFTSELIPTFMVKGNCSYAWLPTKYFPGFGYMGYQRGLPYASTISHMVSKIRETGLMKRTFKKWWGTTSSCSGLTGSDPYTTISMLEAGSAFIILLFGACLAILIGMLEYLLTAKRENWQTSVKLALPGQEFPVLLYVKDDSNNRI